MTYPTSVFPSISLEEVLLNTFLTDTGCLEWQGKRLKNYGYITHKSRHIAVHRLTCFLAHGEPSLGDLALHSCDNPPCVNPEHLRWGTQLDNMADSKARNRRFITRGIKNGRSKLDDKKVIAIRAIYGTGPTTIEIAELYGISNQLVSRIVKGEAWTHVENR
jgi:hypothetical protein